MIGFPEILSLSIPPNVNLSLSDQDMTSICDQNTDRII